jgi:hypothetical protein
VEDADLVESAAKPSPAAKSSIVTRLGYDASYFTVELRELVAKVEKAVDGPPGELFVGVLRVEARRPRSRQYDFWATRCP